MKERPRILIVEDDAHYQEFLTCTLEREYLTDVAQDGDQFLSGHSVGERTRTPFSS